MASDELAGGESMVRLMASSSFQFGDVDLGRGEHVAISARHQVVNDPESWDAQDGLEGIGRKCREAIVTDQHTKRSILFEPLDAGLHQAEVVQHHFTDSMEVP